MVGWLADAKYGRYRVIRSGLWIMWLAAILLLGLSIVNYVIGSDTSSMYGTFAVAIAIYFVGTVGTACFHTNIIPFGIDQMEGCSSEEISSFIHWFYFTRNVNFGMVVEFIITAPRYYCDLNGETSKYDLIISLIQTAFLTAAVCMDFLFSGNLNKDPKIHNPVKKVKAVTKFVLKHKEQVGYRQAVTYTIESPPARSDYAKKPYGGLYSEDDVEDVMAFWRLVVFLIPVGFGGFLVVSVSYVTHLCMNIVYSPIMPVSMVRLTLGYALGKMFYHKIDSNTLYNKTYYYSLLTILRTLDKVKSKVSLFIARP